MAQQNTEIAISQFEHVERLTSPRANNRANERYDMVQRQPVRMKKRENSSSRARPSSLKQAAQSVVL